MGRHLRHWFVLGALVLAIASPSVAAAVEPVDGEFTGAQGPLVGTVAGTTDATDDVDYHYFYVSGLSDVTIKFDSTSGMWLTLYRSWASALLPDYASGGYRFPAWMMLQHVDETYQLPAGLYYAKVTGATSGKTYTLSVTGTGVVSAPPSTSDTFRAASILPEIYESSYTKAQLLAPYAVYRGETAAEADVDWYKFYVTSKSDVHIGWDFPAHIYSEIAVFRGKPANSLVADTFTGDYSSQLSPGVYYIRMSDKGFGHTYWLSVHGARVSQNPYAKLGRPTAPKSVKRGRRFSVSGTIAVPHADGTKGTSLRCYRRQGRKWVLRKTFVAPHRNPTAQGTVYAATLKLPYKGEWRIRAKHVDAGHLATYSSYRYVTVK